MVFRTREREDGNFELALDAEGITHLEQGLQELRYMEPGEAAASPLLDEDGVAQFMLKRVQDEEG